MGPWVQILTPLWEFCPALHFLLSFHLSGQLRQGDSSGPKQMNSQSSGLWCQDGGKGRLLPMMRTWLLSPPSSPAPPGFDFQPPALFSLPPYSQWEQHWKQRKGESDSCCRGIFAHGWWNDLAPDSLEGGAAGRLLYISVP